MRNYIYFLSVYETGKDISSICLVKSKLFCCLSDLTPPCNFELNRMARMAGVSPEEPDERPKDEQLLIRRGSSAI